MGDLRIPFNDAELASIRDIAERLGLTVEDFVRQSSLGSRTVFTEGPPSDRGKIAREIRAGQKKQHGSPSTKMLRELRDGR